MKLIWQPPCNYVHICSKTKRQTWLLMAFSFKSLWTLGRTTQCDDISTMSCQGLNVQGRRRNWSLSFPCSSLVKLQNCPIICLPSVHLSVNHKILKLKRLLFMHKLFWNDNKDFLVPSMPLHHVIVSWMKAVHYRIWNENIKKGGNWDISSYPGGHISQRLCL